MDTIVVQVHNGTCIVGDSGRRCWGLIGMWEVRRDEVGDEDEGNEAM